MALLISGAHTKALGTTASESALRESGFTLIEIAIVIVVIGLLLGVVLKGQELITSARVRSIISQEDDIRVAYFAYIDRFGAFPGDDGLAASRLGGVGTACANGGNGNANGRIETANGESILVWEHLSRAGLLSGSYRCSSNTTIDPTTTPTNAFNQFLQLAYDNNFTGNNSTSRHNLKTGSQMPSYLLAEIDRKIDDGSALEGAFRGSSYTTGAAVDPSCWDNTTGIWASSAQNCSGARFF